MPARRFATVDEYFEAQPPRARDALQRVRDAIRDALPDATEAIGYNMPAFKRGKRAVIHLAAWKDHYGLYLATKPIVDALGAELNDCTLEKGTIRFPLDGEVSTELIARIVRLRAELVR